MQLPQEHELDEALFWAKIFVEGISDAVIVLNTSNQALWWNSIAGDLFGMNENIHQKEEITNIIKQVEFTQYLTEREGGTIEVPSPVMPEVMLSVVLIPSGSLILLVAQDISGRHHIDRMRQDFVANVSHEMRTPLTVIQGYLEMMQQEIPAVLPDWKESILQMQSQMGRLENLLEELLLLAKLEGSKQSGSDLYLLNISELVTLLVKDAEGLSAGRHQFTLKVDKKLYMRGNEKELRSCFGNLLSNAIRYSPDGGNIEIQWYCDKKGAYFCVKDEGLGIARKHIPRLTERFYRVDKGRSRETGGTGLGLSIVKHVLIRHQATLKAESSLRVGSRFICTFPLSVIKLQE